MFNFTQWVNRAGLGLNKFTNSGTAANLVLTPNPDAISNPGTPITAQKLNHMENGIQITSDTLDRCFAFFSDFHILANAEAKLAHDILINGFGNSSGMTLNDWTISAGKISVTTPTPGTLYYYDRYEYTQNPPTYSIGSDTDYTSETFSSGTRTITGYTDAPLSANGYFNGTGAYNSLTMEYDGQQGHYYRYQISGDGLTRTTYELNIDPDLIGDSYLNSWKNAVVETPGAYVKGDQVDTIEAPAGLYPDDGVSGAYWYVKNGTVPTPSSVVAVAESSVYTLSETKNAVTLEGVHTDATTAYVSYQVTLDGSSWYDIAPGGAAIVSPGSSLQVRILGNFPDLTSQTLTCDGFAVLCYNAEVEQ